MTSRSPRPLIAAFTLTLLAAACASPGARPDVATAAIATPAAAAEASAIPGLRRPRPLLLTSAQPDAAAWRDLAGEGVGLVVNLRPDGEMAGRDEAAEVAAAGMAYAHVPVAGPADLDDANAARLWSLVEGAGAPVLVHCASGNRAGALLAIGAARAGAMTPQEALAFGRSAGMTSPALEEAVRARLGLSPAPR